MNRTKRKKYRALSKNFWLAIAAQAIARNPFIERIKKRALDKKEKWSQKSVNKNRINARIRKLTRDRKKAGYNEENN